LVFAYMWLPMDEFIRETPAFNRCSVVFAKLFKIPGVKCDTVPRALG